jgi:hypothetical protein
VLARVGKIVGLPEPKQPLLGVNSDGKTLLTPSIQEPGQDIGEVVQRGDVEDMGKIVEGGVGREECGITGGPEESRASKMSIAIEADCTIDLDSGAVRQRGTVAQKTPTLETSAQQEVEKVKSTTTPKKQDKKRKKHKRNVIDDLFGHLV